MSVGCRIRPAQESDLPRMVELLQQLFAIEADFVGDPATQERGLRLLLHSPTGRIWVAVADDRVIGLCSLQILISTAEGGLVGLVEDVVVAEDCRGRGIGPGLLEHLEDWARREGLTRLQLLADRNNQPALDFYRRRGWAETQLVALRKLRAAPAD